MNLYRAIHMPVEQSLPSILAPAYVAETAILITELIQFLLLHDTHPGMLRLIPSL